MQKCESNFSFFHRIAYFVLERVHPKSWSSKKENPSQSVFNSTILGMNRYHFSVAFSEEHDEHFILFHVFYLFGSRLLGGAEETSP
jgi:hypothetical protein